MTHVEKIEIEIMIEFTQDEKDKMKKEQAWLQSRSFLSDVLSGYSWYFALKPWQEELMKEILEEHPSMLDDDQHFVKLGWHNILLNNRYFNR